MVVRVVVVVVVIRGLLAVDGKVLGVRCRVVAKASQQEDPGSIATDHNTMTVHHWRCNVLMIPY